MRRAMKVSRIKAEYICENERIDRCNNKAAKSRGGKNKHFSKIKNLIHEIIKTQSETDIN